MSCRICSGELGLVLSLGRHPIPNALPTRPDLGERRFPLDLMRCDHCGLFQLGGVLPKEALFGEHYAYATPDSPALTAHYRRVYELCGEVGVYAEVLLRANRRPGFVVEVGSNNGAFLVPMPWEGAKLGVEPSLDVGEIARGRGLETLDYCFTKVVAEGIRRDRGPADLIVMRHCLAHVDDIHELVAAAKILLSERGVLFIENAYVVSTLLGGQYDQIYHEHMSYLAAEPMQMLAEAHGLTLLRVAEAPVHGGSVLFFLARPGVHRTDPSVEAALAREEGLDEAGYVATFVRGAERSIAELGAMVRSLAAEGKVIDCYGAAAKGVTVLNAAGLTRKEIRQCLDSSPLKHGHYVPGTAIPIVDKAAWQSSNFAWPDYAIVTAWNYLDEIRADEQAYEKAGGKWIVPVPLPRVIG